MRRDHPRLASSSAPSQWRVQHGHHGHARDLERVLRYFSLRRGSSLATQMVKPLETCRAFSHSFLVSKLVKMYQRDSGASFFCIRSLEVDGGIIKYQPTRARAEAWRLFMSRACASYFCYETQPASTTIMVKFIVLS
jgi:hypothetical protein